MLHGAPAGCSNRTRRDGLDAPDVRRYRVSLGTTDVHSHTMLVLLNQATWVCIADLEQTARPLPGTNRFKMSASPYQPTFAAIDFETANTSRDSACAVGVAVVRDGRLAELRRSLIRPPTRQFTFTSIHGLTWRDVHRKQTFGAIWRDLRNLVSQAEFLCAHNASFDRSVLRACCLHHRLSPPRQPFLCTVRLARSQWGIYPTKLSDVCRTLGIPLNHHEAGSDAQACAQIVLRAIDHGWTFTRQHGRR